MAERIYLGQMIEHLAFPRGVRACLHEAARALRTDGVCCLVTPDWQAMKEKRLPPDHFDHAATGMRRWPGDEHRWRPDRWRVHTEVSRYFATVLPVNVMNLPAEWPPGARDLWDCCVLAADPTVGALS